MQEHRTIAKSKAPVTAGDTVVRRLPRRQLAYSLDSISVALPRARRVYFKPGTVRPILRLFVWLGGAVRFLWAICSTS